jgi:hypothetical protein
MIHEGFLVTHDFGTLDDDSLTTDSLTPSSLLLITHHTGVPIDPPDPTNYVRVEFSPSVLAGYNFLDYVLTCTVGLLYVRARTVRVLTGSRIAAFLSVCHRRHILFFFPFE